MKRCFPFAVLIQILVFQSAIGQTSVQLKVKESSGFLGLGAPKFIELELSNQTVQKPLNSANINAGQYFYFECKPAGDWKLDESFVKDNLPKLAIEQGGRKTLPEYIGEISVESDSTSVHLGYPKTFNLEDPFMFTLELGKARAQVEMRVPTEYWPGYGVMATLTTNADRAYASGRFRDAIAAYNAILANNALQKFPQYNESKIRLLRTIRSYLDASVEGYQGLRDTAHVDVKAKIAGIVGYKPAFLFVIDSLPSWRFRISPFDSNGVALLDQAKKAILQIGSITDSLQNSMDEKTVDWVLEGSATGRNGIQYQYMIETLAYAYSSLDFADTNATELRVTIPSWLQTRLDQNGLTDSYQTFVRVCSDRYQMRLAVFPVDFLPNLRKNATAFPLPFFAMLQAVNDFYAGNLSGCNNAIMRVLKTCYVSELLGRFDNLRVIVNERLNPAPQNVLKLLDEGRAFEAKKDLASAGDRYRQAVILAPMFAYAAYRLGRFQSQSGDSALAGTMLKNAYQLDTLYRSAYRECFNLYAQRQDYRSMIEVMSYALAHGNDSWETNFLLGDALLGAGDALRAVDRFARALELNSRSYETCIQLGNAYQDAKNYLRAREYFNKAIEIDAMRNDAVDALSKLNLLERRKH